MAEPPEPRREPRTAEGRAIVDAIAEATALLLDRDGYEALTTNAIARVAGVSIGSLYQYFGDKQAVVLEVARRLEGRALEVAMERAEGLGDTSAREATAQLVDVLLDPRLGGPASRRALLLQVPPAWLLPASGPTDRSTERLLRAVMEALPFREGPRDVMAFVVFHAVEGVIEDALLHRPVALFEGAFRRELFSLAWRYLAPAGADLSPHPVRTPDAWPPPSAALSARLADEPPAEEATPVHRVTPKSARGRASVEAILEAALERLAEAGWEGASARSIAKRAGVSAATLYRYFPHLRAIVAELARRRETRLLELAEAALPPSDGRPLAPSLGPLVEALCARSREDRRARRAVLAEVPQAWNRAVTDEVDAALVMLAERHLAERPDGREGASARVAVAALRHGLESAIVTRPELLEDPRFGEELRALLARYLLQREAWG